MSSIEVKRKKQVNAENISGWDALIEQAKGRVEDLQFSIMVFERKKKQGEPCPWGYAGSDSELVGMAAGTAKKGHSVPA